jgi:hypothetical protein
VSGLNGVKCGELVEFYCEWVKAVNYGELVEFYFEYSKLCDLSGIVCILL